MLTRRQFLKLSAAGLSSLAFNPIKSAWLSYDSNEMVRVAIQSVSVYSQPDDRSSIVATHYRDELINVYYDVISDKGPGYNPLWYRVWRGYMHSAHLQKVQVILNEPLPSVSSDGVLMEVTVPWSQSYRHTKMYGWQENYRLYQTSLHWICGVEEGPDGEPWYRIRDELLRADIENYFAPAIHFRPVPKEMFDPISPDIPPDQKRVEVDRSTQILRAFEADQEVFKATVSTGIPTASLNCKTWETPSGKFHVYAKLPSKHMGGGYFSSDPEDYILPGIPWVSFFIENGIAFHGTYWHNNFGMTMSHGCVNMRNIDANWIFRWVNPVAPMGKIETDGTGTLVVVR